MAYQQPYTITVNKTGSDGCSYDGPATIEGYCCMCGGDCGPDATPCEIALSWSNLYEGQCAPTTTTGTINIQNQCDPSCNVPPPGGIECPDEYVVTHEINLACTPIDCNQSYLSGGFYGDGSEECPRVSDYWNGCGNYTMTCPPGSDAPCDEYHTCNGDANAPGDCQCNWTTSTAACAAQGWTCGDNPCIHSTPGVCGTANECQTCNVHYIEEIPEILEVSGYGTAYELPTPSDDASLDQAVSIELTINYRRLYGDIWVGIQNYSGANDDANINWIVQNVNLNYNCNTEQTTTYVFDSSIFTGVGTYRIIVLNGHSGWDGGSTCALENGTGGLGSLDCSGLMFISENIVVSDDTIPGCTDTCATNYNSTATTDDGSCEFSGCTDSAGTNYFCLGGCDASSDVCDTDGIGNYDFSDIVDDGLTCTFPPQAVITTPQGWGGINEGTELLLQGSESNAFVINGDSNCAYEGCYGDYSDSITTYQWNVDSSLNITAGQDTSFPLSASGSEFGPFAIPYYDSGGGTITANLTVTNSVTSNTAEEIIEIADVDIIGTEISDFAAIYIPGGYEWTYIPCTLPPGEYDLNTILGLSFFISDPTGEDNPQDFQSWVTGDQISTKQCIAQPCNFSLDETTGNYVNGSSMYFEGFGWTTGAGTASPDTFAIPGGAYMISTTNPGWIRWSV